MSKPEGWPEHIGISADVRVGESEGSALLRAAVKDANALRWRLDRIATACKAARANDAQVDPETILHLINE